MCVSVFVLVFIFHLQVVAVERTKAAAAKEIVSTSSCACHGRVSKLSLYHVCFARACVDTEQAALQAQVMVFIQLCTCLL